MPRRRSQNCINGTQKLVKSNNLIEYLSIDFINILTSMMNEKCYRWRKDVKKPQCVTKTPQYLSKALERVSRVS